MFASHSSLKCAVFAAALSFTLTACDDLPFTDTDAGEDTDTNYRGDKEPCEIRTGALNPDALGWVYPWLALEFSETCDEADLAHVQISINGAPIDGHKVLQMGSLDEPNCAILIFDRHADNAQPWILDWTATGDAFGAGHVDTSEVADFFPGWSVYLHEGALTASPAWYGPRCAVPLDWHLDPKPW